MTDDLPGVNQFSLNAFMSLVGRVHRCNGRYGFRLESDWRTGPVATVCAAPTCAWSASAQEIIRLYYAKSDANLCRECGRLLQEVALFTSTYNRCFHCEPSTGS